MILLDEELKQISPQEAKDKKFFGPVYHGTTEEKRGKIGIEGFRVFVGGHERSGDISHGYNIKDYNGGIPAPIHHLGFGTYFTTKKDIAKKFSYGNKILGPFFLDVPRLLTINWGSPNTMMKWWMENGYNYDKNLFIWNDHTLKYDDDRCEKIRKERFRATLNMTEHLKSKYDGVWYKGKGIRRMLDEDQVVVFDPNRVYKLDKTLTKPGEIGSIVVAKVGIDPYGRGEIKIPIGTKGIIIDKKEWEGSNQYAVKWDVGGVMYNVIDKWIEPYQRAKLKEYVIQRRGFWKEYEDLVKENETKKKNTRLGKCFELSGRHVTHNKDDTLIHGEITNPKNNHKFLHAWVKLSDGRIFDPVTNIKWPEDAFTRFYNAKVIEEYPYINVLKNILKYRHWGPWSEEFPPKPLPKLEESSEITYSPITKMEEAEVINVIKKRWGVDNELGKTLKKIGIDKRSISYKGYINGDPYIFKITRTYDGLGIGYFLKDVNDSIDEDPFYRLTYSGDFLTEDIGKKYSPMTKMEEEESLYNVMLKLKSKRCVELFKKISQQNKVDINRSGQYADIREYQFQNRDNIIKTDFLIIKKIGDEFFYRTFNRLERLEYDKYPRSFGFTNIYTGQVILEGVLNPHRNSEYEEGNWKEGDEDHAQALQQTGYWGRQGAGAIILAKDTGRILLPLRSRLVEQPNTWGVWGGAIDDKEDPASAVRRELSEEVGHNLHIDELIPMYVFEDPRVGFRYSNFLAIVSREFVPRLNWETQKTDWIQFGKWPTPLHFGLKALLQHSGNRILEEVKKYSKYQLQESVEQSDSKEKYKAAISIIKMVWADMARGGDYKSKFDYGNSFSHWMFNNEHIHNDLLTKYGQQFYPNSEEPHYDFAEYIEKVLEMLELKHYKRITKKVDKDDPLYYLKQTVKSVSWEKAKKNLKTLTAGNMANTISNVSDDMAENIFNRLYKSAMGETYFDASNMKFTVRLDKMIIEPGADETTKIFIQQYNQKGADRFPNKVKVWRGLHTPTAKIRPGDFVTFDNAYARGYVSSGKHGAVVSDILPTKDLLVFKPDVGHSELIYWPEGHQIQKYTGPIPTFKEFYLQYK